LYHGLQERLYRECPAGVINITGTVVNMAGITNFTTDPSSSQAITTFKSPTPLEMQVTFINFDQQTNVGNVEPFAVGTLRHKPLFLSYRVTDLPGSGKTLHFNFYSKPEVRNVN
jgi:hypothetical protein